MSYREEMIKIGIEGMTEDEKYVSGMIQDVRLRGDKALFESVERFNGCKLDKLEVTKEEIDNACRQIGFTNKDFKWVERSNRPFDHIRELAWGNPKFFTRLKWKITDRIDTFITHMTCPKV